MLKLLVRIKGGLGNQLFCYGAARRLALMNNAELVIDNVSGFVRDRTYRRNYALDNFSIAARRATRAERLEPFERYRRAFAKWRSRQLPFEQRRYIDQELIDFDPRLLDLRLIGFVCLDGLWQSEAYFADIAQLLREDLRIKPPADPANQDVAEKIFRCTEPVALHIRWFDASVIIEHTRNVSIEYYQAALTLIQANVERPHFFIFSDAPEAAAKRLSLPAGSFTVVSHNTSDEMAYADLWLMSQCRHFITANSTFSWWGAWLGEKVGSVVITPDPSTLAPGNSWGTRGLLPNRWIRAGTRHGSQSNVSNL